MPAQPRCAAAAAAAVDCQMCWRTTARWIQHHPLCCSTASTMNGCESRAASTGTEKLVTATCPDRIPRSPRGCTAAQLPWPTVVRGAARTIAARNTSGVQYYCIPSMGLYGSIVSPRHTPPHSLTQYDSRPCSTMHYHHIVSPSLSLLSTSHYSASCCCSCCAPFLMMMTDENPAERRTQCRRIVPPSLDALTAALSSARATWIPHRRVNVVSK